MRFGDKVMVRRGSERILSGPGRLREVPGVLVGRRGRQSIVRISVDDPDATVDYCTRAGDVGSWATSAVREWPKD